MPPRNLQEPQKIGMRGLRERPLKTQSQGPDDTVFTLTDSGVRGELKNQALPLSKPLQSIIILWEGKRGFQWIELNFFLTSIA